MDCTFNPSTPYFHHCVLNTYDLSQLESSQYKPALSLIDSLLTELKRLDDKMILTEVHLLESRVYRGTGNLAKAKAALTSARTAANSIYCPPHLQAQLDLQSGVLHAEDKDYKTACVLSSSVPVRWLTLANRVAATRTSSRRSRTSRRKMTRKRLQHSSTCFYARSC